ncbi:translation initiation factor IF-2 [Candidatus Liberibacter americanus]|uniref:Translation initiation factor IF-2 n=1 Tax=Candidatus Liberibacter americanus str. Sao Paulo TaxID=1261131 RepID=U6B724_9HYPH|nr:translation initiation factor IF-2 [Candidatus Liberibacter americanus]AHA27547.1 Translation initiation factor 2 [Candidatus Liberibacter americanus str. Sao Paulo]EMS36492.1 translation initiation factor IF-2 [Candidatus Liberibacter americanus PW_SP]
MTNNKDSNTSNVEEKKTLTLRTPSSSINHSIVQKNKGRPRSVVVETRKRRSYVQGGEKISVVRKSSRIIDCNTGNFPDLVQQDKSKRRAEALPCDRKLGPKKAESSFGDLSQGEIDSRRRALLEAQVRDIEEAKIKLEKQAQEEMMALDAKSDQSFDQILSSNKEADDVQSDIIIENEVSSSLDISGMKPSYDKEPYKEVRERSRKTEDGLPASRGKSRFTEGKSSSVNSLKAAPRSKTDSDEKKYKKLKIISVDNDDGAERLRGRSLAAIRRRKEKFRRSQHQGRREKVSREIVISETITIQELSQRMSERSTDVIKFLMKEGQTLKPEDVIDADLSEIIANEFGHVVKRVLDSDVELGVFDVNDDEDNLDSRPPVVTVMGHVNHGKTSLLDAIRNSNVLKGEFGSITQHIGAYQVDYKGEKITFIDTPGHAAFYSMRARGTRITDIAIIVLAADEDIQPQAIESINHAKSAGVSIIIAFNKIDKSSADIQKLRVELLKHDVFVESMGGEILDVEISAKKNLNLDKLLDSVLLQAEILGLKANVNRKAEGSVIEGRLDRGRGSVVTVLVQKGRLQVSDIIVIGDYWGKVRSLFNDKGKSVKEALPSMPVEILGLQGVPMAGDKFGVVETESRAREISQYRKRLTRNKSISLKSGSRCSLEKFLNNSITSLESKKLSLIIKGDVQGSVEAIVNSLEELGTSEVCVSVVSSGAGAINETDVSLAKASDAIIFGFNVRSSSQARDLAAKNGVKIINCKIIYDLIDGVKEHMSNLLPPEVRETFLGRAEVLEVFSVTKLGNVAGCKVIEGKVERGAGIRILRKEDVVYNGKMNTLKRFKDEVSEVEAGQDCGIAFEKYDNIQVGDLIECFSVEHIKRSL